MLRLTNNEIEEIANSVVEKLTMDHDIDAMQEIIEGDRVYLTVERVSPYSGLDMTEAILDIMTRFPYYDKNKGMRYGSRREWLKVTPNSTVQSSDLLD